MYTSIRPNITQSLLSQHLAVNMLVLKLMHNIVEYINNVVHRRMFLYTLNTFFFRVTISRKLQFMQ